MATGSRSRTFLSAWWAKTTDNLHTMQLAHFGGKYSIERMLALEEYTRSTSLFRVLFVTIGAPFAVVLFVAGQECIPLQNPHDGWKTNYGFWARVAFANFAIGNACAIQIGFWLDVPALSIGQRLLYCLCMGISLVGSGMLVAETWVFPVPFFMITLSIVMTITLVLVLRLVVGARAFWNIVSQRPQLRRLSKVSSLQGMMCFLYPAYQVIFNKADQTSYELPMILALPVFKVIMKGVFASSASHKEDMVPAQVVFTVDFFDALYLASFMQSLSSTSLVAIMAVDIIDTAIELRDLHYRTQHMTSCLMKTANTEGADGRNLIVAVRALCSNSEALRAQMRAEIRVHSCIFHHLSPEGRELVRKFDDIFERKKLGHDSIQNSFSAVRMSSRSVFPTEKCPTNRTGSRKIVAVLPNPVQKLKPKCTKAHNKSLSNPVAATSILQEALEVLFTSECIILTEYLEMFIPLIYASYILTMVHLPSAQYHSEMDGVTPENVGGKVSNMFLYAMLEFVSFVVLAVITKRNCGIDALYQLAFVLETQMAFIQSTLMLWILYTLTFRVAHFGVDLSFQFDWIGQ